MDCRGARAAGRVIIRHVNLNLVTCWISPSICVACPLATFGSSISPWYKPALTILCRKGDFHYNEMTKDFDFTLNPMLFVSLPGELDQL